MSAHAFEMLGTQAALGRAFDPRRRQSKHQRVVVLTHGLWERRFGAECELDGKTRPQRGQLHRRRCSSVRVCFSVAGFGTGCADQLDTDPRRADRDTNFLRAFARLKRAFPASKRRPIWLRSPAVATGVSRGQRQKDRAPRLSCRERLSALPEGAAAAALRGWLVLLVACSTSRTFCWHALRPTQRMAIRGRLERAVRGL